MEGWKATRLGIRDMVEGGREGVRGTEVDKVDEEDEVDKVAEGGEVADRTAGISILPVRGRNHPM